MACGLCCASLGHHQKKPYPGREGDSGHSPHSGAEFPRLWGAASQPHAKQCWCLCAAPGENSNFRGSCLTYF